MSTAKPTQKTLANQLRRQRAQARNPRFSMPVSSPKKLDIEAMPWWWNPSRIGVCGGPPSFERELELIDPNLRVTRNNYTAKWQIWIKAPRIQTPICSGWNLLFIEERLGPHIFARLYNASMDRWGSAKRYFDAIEREAARIDEADWKREKQDTMDRAMEYGWEHSRIKVGYGASNGTKFCDYHA